MFIKPEKSLKQPLVLIESAVALPCTALKTPFQLVVSIVPLARFFVINVSLLSLYEF